MAPKEQDAHPTGHSQTKNDETNSAAFIQHLEYASSIVKTWPIWKQQLLGGTAVKQPSSSSIHTS